MLSFAFDILGIKRILIFYHLGHSEMTSHNQGRGRDLTRNFNDHFCVTEEGWSGQIRVTPFKTGPKLEQRDLWGNTNRSKICHNLVIQQVVIFIKFLSQSKVNSVTANVLLCFSLKWYATLQHCNFIYTAIVLRMAKAHRGTDTWTKIHIFN